MMNSKIALALLALALAPAQLLAQSPEARIEAAKSRSTAAGVPVSLLENRVAEGRAKGVPMDRIAAAVERRAASLIAARDAMGRTRRDLTPADLGAGADALDAGIPGGHLRTVIEQARSGERSVAIAVLTYLHQTEGLPVDQALAQVTGALGKGPDALRALPAQAAAARQRRGQGANGQPGAPGRGNGNGNGPPAAVPSPGNRPGTANPGNGGGAGKGQGGVPKGKK
jgi:hypothetical protein